MKLLVIHIKIGFFGGMLTLVGASVAMFTLLFVRFQSLLMKLASHCSTFQEKSKVWKIIWLTHQAILIELFVMICLKMMRSEKFPERFFATVIPAVTFVLLQIFSWFLVFMAIKQLRKDEKKNESTAQWIVNSLIGSPYARLTFPVPNLSQSV